MIGGKFLDKGSFKCVFKPSIKCRGRGSRYGEEDGTENQYISAIMTKDAIAEELGEMDKIDAIDPEHNFTLGGVVEDCEIGDFDPIEEPESELSKCEDLYSPDNKNLRNIILRYGGIALHKLPQTPEIMMSLYYNFDKVLEDFIILRDNHFCHADVKPQNILFNPELGKYKLIDFGWSFCTAYNEGDRRLCAPHGMDGIKNINIDTQFAATGLSDPNTGQYLEILRKDGEEQEMYIKSLGGDPRKLNNKSFLALINNFILTDERFNLLFTYYNNPVESPMPKVNTIIGFSEYKYWPVDLALSLILQVYLKHNYLGGIKNILDKYPSIKKIYQLNFTHQSMSIDLEKIAHNFINASLSKFDNFSLGVLLQSFYLKQTNLELLPNTELIKKIIDDLGLDLMNINPLERITLEEAIDRWQEVKSLLHPHILVDEQELEDAFELELNELLTALD